MSSYLKDLEHNGVASGQVATKMKIQLPVSISSPRVGSISARAVAVDVVDMLVRKVIQLAKVCRVMEGPWDVSLGQTPRFTTSDTKVYFENIFFLNS